MVTKKHLNFVADALALWSLLWGIGMLYAWLMEQFPLMLVIGGTILLWLAIGGIAVWLLFFSKRNQRGALGCQTHPMNIVDGEAIVQVVLVTPIIIPLFAWDAFKKKVGLE